MAESVRCLRHTDYTIGWISALPIEFGAAIKMLDERHCDLPQNENSSVAYILGSIGPHNIVMACLSAGQMGAASAAMVAREMRSAFPKVRFGLLVGIGGGVPLPYDVHLGDIIVSQPGSGQGGVVQYDFGKNTTGGFERTSFLNAPPDILLNTLSKYQALNLDAGSLTSHRFKPKEMIDALSKFPTTDVLFQADYNHTGGVTCKDCDKSKVLRITDRHNIMVHYGTIASGSQVIKSGIVRDQLSKELGGILCFEMEAAGIMNTFPCIVIRGVCDYADSHKNKDWQPFAASAAAAYGKEFLNLVPSSRSIDVTQLLDSRTSLIKFKPSRRPQDFSRDAKNCRSKIEELIQTDYFISQEISTYDAARVHWEFAHRRCPGTTRWILDHKLYIQWRTSDDLNCLWLTGKIGSGKTLLTSTVIEQLLMTVRDDDEIVLHFFYRYLYKAQLNAITLLNSWIRQTLDHLKTLNRSYSATIAASLRNSYGQSKLCSFDEVFETVFQPLLKMLKHVTLVIDGLDECDNSEVWIVLKAIRQLLQTPKRKVFVSGRESLDIVNSIPGVSSIAVSGLNSTADISQYINWKLAEKQFERRIIEDEEVLAEIKTILLDNAEQMILWVRLQIDCLWEDCSNDAEIRAALKNLPKDLTDIYDRCLQKILSYRDIYSRGYAARILLWMLEAVQPLTIIQLCQALAINLETGMLDRDKIPSAQDTLRSCANLIVQNSQQEVLLAHRSVYRYLECRLVEGKLLQIPAHIKPTEASKCPFDRSLAKLCVWHLISASYNLALQQMPQNSKVCLDSATMVPITEAVPRVIRPFLPQPKPVQMNLPRRRSPAVTMAEPPEFFLYAREQWPYLTKDWKFSTSSSTGNIASEDRKFYNLVLQPNLTWKFHPWTPLGQSLDSHYFGLLGWSIVHGHRPMFMCLVANPSIKPREDLFACPFHQYNDLNSVLLVARSNAAWAYDAIQSRVSKTAWKNLINSQDHRGWTLSHYAAMVGSIEIFNMLSKSTNFDAEDKQGLTPIVIAITKGHTETARWILRKQMLTQASLLQAIPAAIEYGCFPLFENIKLSELLPIKVIESSIRVTIKRGDVATLERVLARLAPEMLPQLLEIILLAAIVSSQVVVVDLVLAKRYYLSDRRMIEILMQGVGKSSSAGNITRRRVNLAIIDKILGALTHDALARVGNDLLHLAITTKATQLLESLLGHGIKPNERVGSDATPLRMALSFEDCEIVQILLEKDGLDHLDPPFDIVIEKDNLQLARLLLKFGADSHVLLPALERRGTALLLAAEKGSDDMFRLLLDHCRDMEIRNDLGETALMLASMHGSAAKVRMLCNLSRTRNKAISINRWNGRERTAFFLSCLNQQFKCAEVLLEHGADATIQDETGNSVVHGMMEVFATLSPPYNEAKTEPFRNFIERVSLDIDLKNFEGRTALHSAIMKRDKKAVRQLISWGADPDAQDGLFGDTPFHLAVKMSTNHLDSSIWIIHYLLDSPKKANLNIQNCYGDTALHVAMRSDRPDVVMELIKAGASP